MHKSGWEAPTYPSFDFRQSAEKSLVLSLKLASARTLRARRSGTGPGRWVDLASLKASRPRMNAHGRAGRPRSRHFTAKRWPKTKLALHMRIRYDLPVNHGRRDRGVVFETTWLLVPVQRHRGEPGHTRDRHKNLTNQPQNQPHPPTHAPDHTRTPGRTRRTTPHHSPASAVR